MEEPSALFIKQFSRMSKRSAIIGVAFTALVIAIIVFASVQARAPKKITIGFIGPLTGNPSVWGVGSRNMVALAAEDINAKGGIDGKQVEVIYEDGKCAAPSAVSAFQHLHAEGVKFILGGHCSPETVGIAPLTKDGDAFLLAGLTAADGAVSTSDYAYRTSPDTIEMTRVMAPFVQARFKKIATLTEQTPFAKSFTTDLESAAKKLGVEVVAHEEFPANAVDLSSVVLRLKNSGADAIMISPQSPITGTAAMISIKGLGITLPVFGNTLFVSQEVFDKSGKPANMLGAFSIGPYANPQAAGAAELISKYKSRFNADVPYNLYYVGASYDATMMLSAAITKCGAAAATTQCVADYFKTAEYNGAVGHYQFKENGDIQNVTWAKVSISQEGKLAVEPLQ